MYFLIFLAIVFGVIYVLVPFFIWSLLYNINEKMDLIIGRLGGNITNNSNSTNNSNNQNV